MLHKPKIQVFSGPPRSCKTNVMEFFDNYEHAFKSLKFTAERVYNIDETGVSTIVESRNIFAQIWTKQFRKDVSCERRAVITACMIISSVGNTVPPVFIFPTRLNDSLMLGALPRRLELVYSPQSSWVTGPLFLRVLEHVKKYTRSSKEDRIILLMDSHESHCTLDSIQYARENGITLVTFPPHCCHRLQTLGVGVMGPFKGKLRVAQHNWLTANPGNVTIIHDLVSLTNANISFLLLRRI